MKPLGCALIVGLALCFFESLGSVHGKNLHRPVRCDIECLLDDYFPLCGTDNKTYINECFLYIENKCHNTSAASVRKAHDGVCQLDQKNCEIPCNGFGYTLNPLCGTNGKTYDNQCELDGRNRCDGTAIKKAYDGECKSTALILTPFL